MVRTPCCDKNGLRKGTWTPEEDRKLMAYVTKYGCWNWRQLPKYAGLSRCGKSCRLRWMNYLRPNIKRGNYTKDEEDTILRLHESLGNRWSAIAAHLPGRTDNEIKNHWHTNLKKRMQKDSVSKKQKQYRSSHPKKNQLQQENTEPNVNLPESTTATSQTSFSPKPSSSSDISSSLSTSESKSDDEFAFFEAYQEPSGNFWTEPFLADNYCMPSEFFTPSLDPLSPFLDEEIIWSYSLCEKHGEWNL